MINSRKLEDLLDPVRERVERFIEACEAQGIELLVTSTYRDHESQNALYAQGRTKDGPKVTNAKGGESWHNYRCAVDVVPLVNGKPVWNDTAMWNRIGKIGIECGLEWAGTWKSFKEMPHFQWTNGLTIAQLKAGATIA